MLDYCDLLICAAEKDSSQGKSLKGLNVIEDSAMRLIKFVNNVLYLAEIKAGNFKVKVETVCLDDIVNEELKFF